MPGAFVQIPVPQHNKVEQTKHNKTSSYNASATKLLGPAEVRQQGSHLPREKGTVLVHSYPFNSSLSRPHNSERHRQTRQTLRTVTQYEVSYQYTPGIRRVTTTTTYIYIYIYIHESIRTRNVFPNPTESVFFHMGNCQACHTSQGTANWCHIHWPFEHLMAHPAGATSFGHSAPIQLVLHPSSIYFPNFFLQLF